LLLFLFLFFVYEGGGGVEGFLEAMFRAPVVVVVEEEEVAGSVEELSRTTKGKKTSHNTELKIEPTVFQGGRVEINP